MFNLDDKFMVSNLKIFLFTIQSVNILSNERHKIIDVPIVLPKLQKSQIPEK